MITVLCSHMGTNALGRALVLAQLVDRLGHPVRLVGSIRASGKIWAPALDMEPKLPMETFELTRHDDYPRAARTLRKILAPGELVIISKSLPTSQGLALMAGVHPHRSVLDIDDWELGFRLALDGGQHLKGARGLARGFFGSLYPSRINTDLGIFCAEALAPLYPHRTVSNQWLQGRFGGQIVRHARDERILDPSLHDGLALRARMGIEGGQRLWVAFIGTPRLHKGIGVLIEAMARLKGPHAPGLMLFGFEATDEVSAGFAQTARALLGEDRLRLEGFFPLSQLPQHVAAADILVVPSLETEASQGQIPAKLFDAMAMAKPVIVSDVNDMAQLVGDAGVVVPPADVTALSEAIDLLCRDDVERRAVGARARASFMARDSLQAVSREFERVLDPLLHRASRT